MGHCMLFLQEIELAEAELKYKAVKKGQIPCKVLFKFCHRGDENKLQAQFLKTNILKLFKTLTPFLMYIINFENILQNEVIK